MDDRKGRQLIDRAVWIGVTIVLGWLVLAGGARPGVLRWARRSHDRVLAWLYAGLGGLGGTSAVLLASWFFFPAGMPARNVLFVLYLLVYFEVTAVLWPLWAAWWIVTR